MKIGTGELIVILAIALIVFGPAKLPELGKVLGETVGTFKRQINSITDEFDLEDTKPAKKAAKPTEPKPEAVEPKPEAAEPVIAENGKEENNG